MTLQFSPLFTISRGYRSWCHTISGPVHTFPDYPWIRNYFFPDSKFPRSHASVFQSNLPVHTYRDSFCYQGFPWEYWQQSMRRGCHLEYSIHDKEVDSILLRHRIKISGFSVTWFRIHNVFKNFHSVLRDKHEVQQWNVNVSSSKKVRRVSGNCAEN